MTAKTITKFLLDSPINLLSRPTPFTVWETNRSHLNRCTIDVTSNLLTLPFISLWKHTSQQRSVDSTCDRHKRPHRSFTEQTFSQRKSGVWCCCSPPQFWGCLLSGRRDFVRFLCYVYKCVCVCSRACLLARLSLCPSPPCKMNQLCYCRRHEFIR